MKTIHTSALAITLLASTVSPTYATSDITGQQVVQGTGASCLTGGVIIGLAMLIAGPATATGTALMTPAMAPAMAPAASIPLTVSSATLLGCGATAAAAVAYYGTAWIYGTLFAEPEYPLLYPSMENSK